MKKMVFVAAAFVALSLASCGGKKADAASSLMDSAKAVVENTAETATEKVDAAAQTATETIDSVAGKVQEVVEKVAQ
ncbi:MAG: hypothetical protein SPJ97_06165 [Bacteroides sp.]|nr:hypothetical protein [Bacteroides sp.]